MIEKSTCEYSNAISNLVKFRLREDFPELKKTPMQRVRASKVGDLDERYPGEVILNVLTIDESVAHAVFVKRGAIVKKLRDMGAANRLLITHRGQVYALASYEGAS